MEKYLFGTGRRKTAVAQVRIFKGKGEYKKVNGKVFSDKLKSELDAIFEMVGLTKKYDLTLITNGGGITSQVESTKLALARAICKIDVENETRMKKEGLLTRDSREKERKKPGLKRARRAPQWAKR